MKRVKQASAAAVMAAALLFVGTGAAQAGTEAGDAEESRVITREVTEDDKCEDVGGGTWCYGWGLDSSGLKSCYSNYFHPTNRHSAWASIGSDQSRDVQDAGLTARAYAVAGHAFTCNVKYNPDAS
ncbi:lactococcin 972 family bacteriocin [Glycomyces sp. NPDC048151]|uniref:lactococcin 972 family bacteriocin n=1 Tax=Glycomyces sp. NPDC048151 TaxID=3364002 RepID=UPI003717B212